MKKIKLSMDYKGKLKLNLMDTLMEEETKKVEIELKSSLGSAWSQEIVISNGTSSWRMKRDFEKKGRDYFTLNNASTKTGNRLQIWVEAKRNEEVLISTRQNIILQGKSYRQKIKELENDMDKVLSVEAVEVAVGGDASAVEKACLYYGYPISINGAWEVNAAIDIYGQYKLVVLGDGYENPAHEEYASTTAIIAGLKTRYPETRIFGYVPIGLDAAWDNSNLELSEIEQRIVNWKNAGATDIFLDEFGYDYYLTRERQNACVMLAKSRGMGVCANAWTMEHVFSRENITLDWIQDLGGNDWQGNPNMIDTVLDEKDYVLFENWLYGYIHMAGEEAVGVQQVSSEGRINQAYEYKFVPRESLGGKTYAEHYKTKSLALDAILEEDQRMYSEGWLAAATLGVDAYCASIFAWGASNPNYIHYKTPDVTGLKGTGRRTFEPMGAQWHYRFKRKVGEKELEVVWTQSEAEKDPSKKMKKQRFEIDITSAAGKNGSLEITMGNNVFNVPVVSGDSVDVVRDKIVAFGYPAAFKDVWEIRKEAPNKVVFETKIPRFVEGENWWTWSVNGLFTPNTTFSIEKGYHNIRKITVDGKFVDADAGKTWQRPDGAGAGSMFFDKELGLPLWSNGSGSWVDATGLER